MRYERHALHNLCTSCSKPLFPIYDLQAAGQVLTRAALATREKSLWRYREVLPLPHEVEPVTFGEGGTPLLRATRLAARLGLASLLVKDEAQNPTQIRPWVKSDKAGKYNVCGMELVSAYQGAQPVQARMDIVMLPRGAAAKSARCRREERKATPQESRRKRRSRSDHQHGNPAPVGYEIRDRAAPPASN
ncbi:hypothetical protein BH18VER1_BH18VER1_02440 [soil metagenome]